MTQTPVSVVVVSRDRPAALLRCLTGLSQVQYAPFEIVVVADEAGCAAVSDLPFASQIKIVAFDTPNISMARNLGVSHAAGDVVAIIDDDAVPEPSWLMYLIAPFERAEVSASGGFVRGRNGISFQWMARSVDEMGATAPMDVNLTQATVLTPKTRCAVKTEGTNMAVRRTVLLELEGFDPAFAFYLDETDLNLRLSRAGHATAIVPMAQVHHGFAPSARRRSDRVPSDLFDVGASWAVFQRKYVGQAKRPDHWRDIRATERKRLIEHMVAGRLLPDDVFRLLRRLDQGYAEGKLRLRGGAQILSTPAAPFKPFPATERKSSIISGRIWQRASLRAEAAERAKAGDIVTLVLLSPTALYHHVRFDNAGFWEQIGGIFGRSDRSDRLFKAYRFGARVKREVQLIRELRLVTDEK